jgi:hypothetical protein
MTTDYHTPIATGAAANAATFNAPMAELDAAIGNATITYPDDPTLFLNGQGDFAAPITYPEDPTKFLNGEGDFAVPATSTSGHVIEEEGSPVTQRANMNFAGAGVSVTDSDGKTLVTIPGDGTVGHIIQNEGADLTQRAKLNFTGAGVTASDVGGVTVVNIPASAYSPGYISENGGGLNYVSEFVYSVSPGVADVNGSILSWDSISRMFTFPNGAVTEYLIHYIYLYESETPGTGAVEESTTAPVWDDALNYYKKTGDATRRCIGWFVSITDVSGYRSIKPFTNIVNGRLSEILIHDSTVELEGFKCLIPGTESQPTSPTSFSLSGVDIPAHATHWYATVWLRRASTTGEVGVGISPNDSIFARTELTYYANAFFSSDYLNNTLTIKMCAGWLPINPDGSLVNYYAVLNAETIAQISAQGARIIR